MGLISWKRFRGRRELPTSRGPIPARRKWTLRGIESLEERALLSISPAAEPPNPPVFFLDLDGTENAQYDGPITVPGMVIPAFELPSQLAGQEQAAAELLVSRLNETFAELGVVFTAEQPATGDYSTIYVGGSGQPFTSYHNYLGLSEQVDHFNQDPNDEALVFSELIGVHARTAKEYIGQVATVVAHEAGHLLGYEHEHDDSSGDPLGEVAFKIPTHIEVAKDVRADLLADGKLSIAGGEYEIHPLIREAIHKYPAFYYGGTVGPDTFPDQPYGQALIHPVDTGFWLTRVLDMAWAAQSSDSYSTEEKSQIMAWSYGFLTHCAADLWAHGTVNDFAEGFFPPFSTLLSEDRNFANAARHFLVESYIEDATPIHDNDAERTILPDGDVSDDSSPQLLFAAPHRFIYETLVKAFPSEPTESRGLLIDGFLSLQATLITQASARGPRPAESFKDLLRSAFEQLQQGQVPQETLETLYTAYLYNWLDEIDGGLRNWSVVGLAIANGLTDAQSRRDLQNTLGQLQGADFDDRRADAEADVGLVDVLLHELNDPNNDGRLDDSFINNHLLPMLGVPAELAQLRGLLQTFGSLLGREIVGPFRLAINPLTEVLDRIGEIPREFVEDFIKARFGFDVDALQLLSDLGSKMDLARISLNGAIIPMFKPESHEQLDAIMGIRGVEQSEPLPDELGLFPTMTFHEGATGQLNSNVEFDKTRFAPYANAVTLAKLVLLMETPPDRETVGARGLSQFFSDQLGEPYDFSLLNVNGDHGGNILTTTLPRPSEKALILVDGKVVGEADSDTRPGIVTIDDEGWRTNSQNRLTEQYRVHPAGPGDATSQWKFPNLASGEYEVSISWLANVELSPATNATYKIFDGNTLLDTIAINQEFFAEDIAIPTFPDDPRSSFIYFQRLGTYDILDGSLRIVLSENATGDVIAGPAMILNEATEVRQIVRPARDADDRFVQQAYGYSERGDGWEDQVYPIGTGNFPLWESELLRPVFRTIFTDWQNGFEQFPDMGDPTSPDPNRDSDIRATRLPSMATPFEALVAAALPDGQDLVITGNVVSNIQGDYVLGRVQGDGVGALDSFTLHVQGEVLITEDIGGGGLFNVTIDAAGGIRIAPGVTLTTRQFTGADPLTGASSGNSGDLTLMAPVIDIDQGARLLAQATGGFLSGNITLTSSVTEAIDWVPGLEDFQLAIARAAIDLGPDVVVMGNDIIVTTFASTTKIAQLELDLIPGDTGLEAFIENELLAILDRFLPDLPIGAAASIAEAEARITVGAGARLLADRNATLDAQAIASSIIETNGQFLGITYGSANPTAAVTIANGVTIIAGEDLTVSATGATNLHVTTEVPEAGDIANISISYGKMRATSTADVEAGATLEAENVTIRAENTNSISNRAIAAGFNDSGIAGAGATLVLGSYTSSALATMGGNVTAENLVVEGRSINTQNQTRGEASVLIPILRGPLLDGVSDLLGDIDLSLEFGGELILPAGLTGPAVNLAGAVVIVESDNRASALIDEGADVNVSGNVDVLSRAEDPFQVSAAASAGDANTAAVGGAAAFSKVGNRATSFVGYNTFVDVGGTLNLDAKAIVPNAATPFDPVLNLNDTHTTAGAFQYLEEHNDEAAIGAAVDSALSPLTATLGSAAPTATSYVHAGGVVDSDGLVGVAGGVNVLRIHNAGVAGIAAGARVNQRQSTLPATQDVSIDAEGSVESVNLGGQPSSLSVQGGSGAGNTAVGGFFNGVFIDNEARAYIEDRAEVAAGRDVDLHSLVNNHVLLASQAGSAAEDIGVDGVVNFASITSRSLAYIEDRARIHAGRDILADADSTTLSVNVAGGAAQGANVAVGVAAAFNRVNATTQAFLGNAADAMLPGGTGGEVGSVQAGRDIRLDADSRQEVWSAGTSGATSPASDRGIGGVESFEALQFGFGVSGDTAFNDLTIDTQAFVRDISVEQAASLALEATDSTDLVAAAGAVTSGNHVGLGGSFARNGIERQTRAFTQSTDIVAGSLSSLATTDDQIITLSNGGSGARASAAVAGSVNLNRLVSITEAALGAGTTANIAGAVTLDALDQTVLHSIAGASSTTALGFLAVGAALDLGSLDKKVNAFLADETTLIAGGDVTVRSNTLDDLHSLSASEASAAVTGDPTRLYVNNATANPYLNATGTAVTGDNLRTTSVALGDVDKDGDLDLITGNFAQFNKVFYNTGSGAFDAGENLGTDSVLDLLRNRDAATRDRLLTSLVPDLTTSIVLADLNGDTYLDVVAGNLGQANRVYLNNGKGKFFGATELGRFDVEVTVRTTVTATNATPEDLRDDIAQALASALTAAGLDPTDVKVELVNGRFELSSPRRFLYSLPAEGVISAARRDAVLQGDANGKLTFTLIYDGQPLAITINTAVTQNKRMATDLAGDVEAAVDEFFLDNLRDDLGNVQVRVDAGGQIAFVLTPHTLSSQVAEDAIAAARSGFKLVSSGGPVIFTLIYDGKPLVISVDPAATTANQNAEHLRADIQAAVDTALRQQGPQGPGAVLVQVDATGRIVFDLATHTLDGSAAEDAIAQARRAGRLSERLTFTLFFSEVDLTQTITTGDIDRDGDIDIIAGNLNNRNRIYFNDGQGNFGPSFDISTDVSLTTSLALGDVDRDGDLDLIAGNVNIGLAPLINQGLIGAQNFIEGTVVAVADLVQNTAVTLLDLVETNLLDRFDFNALADIPIADLIGAGIAQLDDLARAGLLLVEDLFDVDIPAADLLDSGIVTQADLDGLIDTLGNVSLRDLIQSGVVFLEEVLGTDLVGLDALLDDDLDLNALLDSALADLRELIENGLLNVTDLVNDKLDLRKLIDSGLVKLEDLLAGSLLDPSKLDLSGLSVDTLTAALTVGGPTRLYRNIGGGKFAAGVDVSADVGVPTSVTLGDVDRDGDLDLVVGNSGSPNRLYRNNGQGQFGPGSNITTDANLTQQVVLADIDRDNDLDLLVANLGQRNRVYLNNGTGTFSAGTNLGNEADATTSLAVGDVNRDGRVDVMAGNARPATAVSGSGSNLEVTHTVTAHIGDGVTVTTPQTLRVLADDQTDVAMIVGAAASNSLVGVGLSGGRLVLTRNEEASIGAASIVAGGTPGGLRSGDTGVIVAATADDDILAFAAGRATARDLGVAASLILDDVDSSVIATIGAGARIHQDANAAAEQDVIVRAHHQTTGFAAAGSHAAATGATGIGAALDAELLAREVLASIEPGAVVRAKDDIVVDASISETLTAVAAGVSSGSDVSIAGSVAFLRPDTTTRATLGGDVQSEGNIIVTADRTAVIAAGAGTESFSEGTLGIGASVVAVAGTIVTEASIAPDANLVTHGNSGNTLVELAQVNNEGNEVTRQILGLWVGATSTESLFLSSVGGLHGGRNGVVGALVFTALDETTRAFLSPDVLVNAGLFGSTSVNAGQSVGVWAFSHTDMMDRAGASVLGGGLGLGAGVDFSAIVKTTEAILNGDISAKGHIEAQALSDEDMKSVSNSGGVEFLTAFGAAIGGRTFDLTTRAFVAPNARLKAAGTIYVSADDVTEVDQVTHGGDVAIGAAGGAAVNAVVIERTTEAFIGQGADVNALGLNGLAVRNGVFLPTFGDDITFSGDVGVPGLLGTLFNLVTLILDNPLRQGIADAVSDMVGDAAGDGIRNALDFTIVGPPSEDESYSMQRNVIQVTPFVRGVAVSATARDDIETLSVGGSASALGGPELSGVAVVTSNHILAYIDDGARVNFDPTGADASQSVLVAAGTDSYHMGIAGVGAAGFAAVGGSTSLSLIDNLTEAYVDSGADVRARGDVNVLANGSQDLLLTAVGVAAGVSNFVAEGSVPVLSLNSRTRAFINDNAIVDAWGTVNVSARDVTDADLVGGAAALSLSVGTGVSLAVAVIDKDTQAFIGGLATVNARANGGAGATVFGDDINEDGTFETLSNVRGVSVQALSSEDVQAVAGGIGISSGLGFAGAVPFVLLDSDTTAYIGFGAHVNEGPGAGIEQSVNVSAVNSARVLDVAYNRAAGFGTLSASVDVQLIRNDTTAYIDDSAIVRARKDVDVHVLSYKDSDSFVAGGGRVDFAGIMAGLSLVSLREDFNQPIFDNFGITIDPLDHLNNLSDAGSVQQYIDERLFNLTSLTGDGIAGVLALLGNVLGPSADTVAEAIETSAPSGVSDPLENTPESSGNNATIKDATVTGRNVNVVAREKAVFTLDTSYTSLGGSESSVLPYADNRVILASGAHAAASIQTGADVQATQNVTVTSSTDEATTLSGTTTLNSTAAEATAFIEGATVQAGLDVDVSASTTTTATYSAVLPGLGGSSSKSAGNKVRNTTDAHIIDSTVTGASDVSVLATDSVTVATTVNATTQRGSVLDFVAYGYASADNDLDSTVTAYVDNSTVTAIAGDVLVNATSTPQIVSIAVGVATTNDNVAVGASNGRNVVAGTVDAHVSNESHVTAGDTISIDAFLAPDVTAVAGSGAGNLGFASGGGALARNTITTTVTSYVENATATADDVRVAAETTGLLTVVAGAGAGSKVGTLAGAAALNDFRGTIDAHVASDAEVNADSSLFVSAFFGSTIRALTVGASGAGTVAVGGSFTTNEIGGSVKAYLDDATVDSSGTVTVSAGSSPFIESLTGAAGGAGTVGAAGAVALNHISTNIEAKVSGGADVDAAGAVLIDAFDGAFISSGALTATGAGVVVANGAVAKNDIDTIVKALVDASSVDSTGGAVTVSALESANIATFSAGVGGSGTTSVSGSVTLNDIRSTVEAAITSATVTAQGDVVVTADDQATITSTTGQGAFSGVVGIGAAVSTNDIAGTIKARIDGGTVTSTAGSVRLTALSNATILSTTVSGSLGVAGVGLAGSVAVNFIANTVEASITSATVHAGASVTVLADSDNTLTVTIGSIAGGLVGIDGTSVVNTLETTTRAHVTNATVTTGHSGAMVAVKRWNTDSGEPISDENIRGLAVVATSTEDVIVATATGAGGLVGINGDVSVTIVRDTTEAIIRGSTINSAADFGEQVKVKAHQETDIGVFAGGGAVGGVAVGGSSDTTLLRNTTRAVIDNLPAANGSLGKKSVVYAKGVEVSTLTHEDVGVVVAGVAFSGVSVAGAVSVVQFDNLNEATIKNADVFSQGAIQVKADDIADLRSNVGVIAIGAVGTGGSVAVTHIANTTRAQVLGGRLNATGGIQVIADSDDKITTRAGTAGGGAVGIAGAVLVNTIKSTTEAMVGSGSQGVSLFNQDPAFQPGGAFNPGSGQFVRIEANNSATLDSGGGTLGVGLVGVGAAIDVGAIRNRTSADVAAGSRINAAGNIDVLGIASRNLDSVTASFAGGPFGGLNGSVSVLSLGKAIDSDGASEFNQTLRNTVNGDIGVNDPGINLNDAGAGQRALDELDDLSAPSISEALNSSLNTTAVVTQAVVANGTSGAGAVLVSGGAITIKATHTYDVDVTTAQATGGFVALGAGVGKVVVRNNVLAQAGDFSSLQSAGALTIEATDRQTSGQSEINAFGGGLGVVTIGGAVAKLVVDTNTNAHLGASAVITSAGAVNITADHRANVDTEALGLNVGAVAAGGTFATSEVKGTVQAFAAAGAHIGDSTAVGSLGVSATSDSIAEAFSKGGSGGIVSGDFTSATARVLPTISATLNNNVDVEAAGNVTVRTAFVGDANVDITSVSIGGIDIGATRGTAQMTPDLNTTIGTAAITTGGNILVESIADGKVVDAVVEASAGALLGAVGGASIATSSATTGATVASGASLTAGGAVIVRAAADNQAEAETDGFALGIIAAVGRMNGTATASGESKAHFNGDVTAGSLTVDAGGINQADSFVKAAGGGIIASGLSTSSSASVAPVIEAKIGDNAVVQVGNNVVVRSDAMTDADAETRGVSGGALDVGDNSAIATIDPTVLSSLGANVQVDAGGSVFVLSEHHAPTTVEDGSFGGIISVNITLDQLALANHRLNTGDAITYQGVGGQPLGGLIHGATYNVIKVDDNNIQLGSSFDAAQINAATDSIVFAGPHNLHTGDRVVYQTPTATPPINGLSNGTVYFVHVVDATTIKLATTLANAQAGVGINIASGIGVHQLRIDITSTRAGTHTLGEPGSLTAGGVLGLLSPELDVSNPDGIALAKAEGLSGSFLGFKGATATVSVTPTVTATILSSGSVMAGQDVTFLATSDARGSAIADNFYLTVVGKGTGDANTTLTNTVNSNLGSSSHVTAGRDFLLSAHALHNGSINAESAGKGVIDTAVADGRLEIQHDTVARLFSNAQVTAGNNARVEATSDTVANMTVFADGGRLNVASRANDDVSAGGGEPTETEQRGILIGKNSDAALTQTILSAGAGINARTVNLIAEVTRLQATGTATAVAGVGVDQSVSRVDVNDNVRVDLDTNVQVRGTDSIDISARHENVSTAAFSEAGVLDDRSYNYQLTDSIVDTDAGATLTTHDLFIEAVTTAPNFDITGEDPFTEWDITRTITLDADVVLIGSVNPELRVNENGGIDRTVGVTTSSTATSITVNDITNTALAGSMVLDINPLNVTQGFINGSASTITVFDAFEKVTIVNRSTKDLIVNDINPFNSTAMPEITLDAQNLNVTFDVVHDFGPTVIDVQNLSQQATQRVRLAGLINNPVGQTNIHTPGDIIQDNSQGILRANVLDLETTSGNVGVTGVPLRVELVESAARPEGLSIDSGNAINLRLQGRLRDAAVATFTVDADILHAAGLINIILEDAVKETARPSLNYTVTVSEPTVPQTTTVKRHFRPPAGEANAILDVGAFGITPQVIGSTYDFLLLEAGQSIDVFKGTGTSTINLEAGTALLSNLDVSAGTNGNINLTDLAGDLRVGSINSTAGNVTLGSDLGSIVDANNNAAVDVTGTIISVVASANVGAAGNALDINSTTSVGGQAGGNVFLNETAGNLNVTSIATFGGNVTLIAQTGSILESGSDPNSDVRGQTITMQANGSIGTSASDLEIDSSNPAAGSLTASAGTGIFLTETAGALNVQSVDALGGEVRLTVTDASTTGQDLNVLAGGHIIATGNVTLLAGDNLDVSGNISGAVVTLHSDNVSADAGVGSTMTIRSPITGTTVQLLGDVDVDNFKFVGFSGTALVNGAAGADTLNLDLTLVSGMAVGGLTGGTITTQESLNVTGNVMTNASATPARINGTVSLVSTTRTFSVSDGAAAEDLIVGAVLSGGGGLTKNFSGTMVLSANNTYTGTTSVTNGTLLVDGSQPSSPAQVSAGATLAGRGTVGTLTGTGGFVSPGGASAGRLSSGNVSIGSSTTYKVQLNGLTAGTQHDQLSVAGTVNLGGAILDVSMGFQPTAGNTFVILTNDGTDLIQGTFAGLPEKAVFTRINVQYEITYLGGDGNDVVLKYLNTNSAFAERTITSPIYEGGIAVLTGRPVDPNPLDEFILLVNWGDGTPQQRHVFAPDIESVRLEHRYLESRATPYVADLQWLDQHGGGNRDVLSVLVNDTTGVPLIAVGADAGRPAQVRVYNGDDGSERFTILAYAAPFNGGVRVALGDITGDGTPDIITAMASRGGPHVRVFNGVTGEPLPGFFGDFVAYNPSFTGGVFVASGDVDGDGRDDIITAPAAGLSSTVRVFSGIDGSEIGNFSAFESGWLNGVSIAVGDVNADSNDDIIVGRGRGGLPEVRAFSGRDFSLIRSFNAYAAAFSGGVFVGAGDINGDGKEDIITGAGRNGGPQVRVFSGEDNTRLASFFAYAQQFTGGVRVSASDVNGDGFDDIVTGAGTGGGPQVRVFSGVDLARLENYLAFESSFRGGIFVAGAPHGADALRLASDTARAKSPAEPLNEPQLDLIRVAALEHLAAIGISDEELDHLAQVNVGVTDLAGDLLGLARGNTIRLDGDGAGHGWFVDESPETSDDLPASRVDLLSVVLHEFGHILGLEHDDGQSGVMDDTLLPGLRRLPNALLIEHVLASWEE